VRAWLLAVAVLASACALAVPTPTRPAPPSTPTRPAPTSAPPTPSPVLPQPTAAYDTADPRAAVVVFLRAWRGQDFAAMADVVASSLDHDREASARTLRAQFDVKVLRGAEVLDVDRRAPGVARVSVRVWYEFPPGTLHRKRLAPMVLRSDAGAWRLNAASILAEQDDP
jgi:hypothetical protein